VISLSFWWKSTCWLDISREGTDSWLCGIWNRWWGFRMWGEKACWWWLCALVHLSSVLRICELLWDSVRNRCYQY
jgi:hypothetical protein